MNRIRGFIFGAAIGSVITFLFTPQSGKALRNDINAGTKRVRKAVKKAGSASKGLARVIKPDQKKTVKNIYSLGHHKRSVK